MLNAVLLRGTGFSATGEPVADEGAPFLRGEV